MSLKTEHIILKSRKIKFPFFHPGRCSFKFTVPSKLFPSSYLKIYDRVNEVTETLKTETSYTICEMRYFCSTRTEREREREPYAKRGQKRIWLINGALIVCMVKQIMFPNHREKTKIMPDCHAI